MIGHADRCTVADLKVCGAYRNAALAQTRSLVEQVLKVDDYARSEDVDGIVAQDAGGQQIQDEPALVVDDGVTGIVAALIADDYIVPFRKQIDHAALALIAPVCSYDCS